MGSKKTRTLHNKLKDSISRIPQKAAEHHVKLGISFGLRRGVVIGFVIGACTGAVATTVIELLKGGT